MNYDNEMLNKERGKTKDWDEAEILCRYITGNKLDNDIRKRYYKIISFYSWKFSDREEKLWEQMMNKPWIIPYIDGGLRFLKPYSEIRKRLYIMICLLETQPLYADYFIISDKNRLLSYSKILFYGIKGVYFYIVGYIYLRLFYGKYI